MGGPNEVRAKFPSMEEGTQEDWQIVGGHFGPFASKVADRVLDHLNLLDCSMAILAAFRSTGCSTACRPRPAPTATGGTRNMS